jgi:hypothetical protein
MESAWTPLCDVNFLVCRKFEKNRKLKIFFFCLIAIWDQERVGRPPAKKKMRRDLNNHEQAERICEAADFLETWDFLSSVLLIEIT